VAELAAANQLDEDDSIRGVEALVVPVPPAATPSARMVLYTARKGDTLVTIADRFGVSLSQLRRWNKITGIKVTPGSRLHVAESGSLARGSRSHRSGASPTSANAHGNAKAKGSVAKRAAPQNEKGKRANGTSVTTKSSKHNPSAHSKSSARKQK
jgi:membrane-bound lytic murein transglycosylase D